MLRAFAAFPFKEEYFNLFHNQVQSVCDEFEIDLCIADRNKDENIIDCIKENINRCNIFIADVTEKNLNVYYELGFAFALNKEKIIIAQNGTNLPFDIGPHRVIFYNPKNLQPLKQHIRARIVDSDLHSESKKIKISPILYRGDLFEYFIDSVTYNDKTSNTNTIEDKIATALHKDTILPLELIYSSDSGAKYWLRLCNDPLYQAHNKSCEFFKQHFKSIFKEITNVSERFSKYPCDIMSLGPGNGHKDKIIIDELTSAQRQLHQEQFEYYYYPVDVSRLILCYAYNSIYDKLDSYTSNILKVKCINTEFEKLSYFTPVIDYRVAPKLYLLLGNTLGNFKDEKWQLMTIANVMNSGDVLILEQRNVTGKIDLDGDKELQNKLGFAPLSRMHVPYEPDKIQKVHLDGPDSMSQITGTKTISLIYDKASIGKIKREFRNIKLCCVNFYKANELIDALCHKGLNLKCIQYYVSDDNPFIVLVLMKI
jgi:hypothetical protein